MKLFNIAYFALLLSAIFLFADCQTVKKSGSDKSYINFRIIESGAYGGISTPSHRFINNKQAFDSLFHELHKNIYPNPLMEYSPKKDYIFITFGEKSSGGLDYSISKIENSNHTLIVTLQRVQKQEPSFSTDAIASPYIVAEIDKTHSNKVDLKTE